MSSEILRIAQTVTSTEAEGPGSRFAIWFQGCPLHCAECCNPEMLSTSGGQVVSIDELLAQIDHAIARHPIEGITLIGGEPLAQPEAAARLARGCQNRGLSVMVFSGYRLDEIRRMDNRAIEDLLQHTDVLVDGPYDPQQQETQRRWIGSANQRVHFLSNRYQALDPCWQLPNTLEIRFNGTELSVNGFPAPSAVGLWKRPRTTRTE